MKDQFVELDYESGRLRIFLDGKKVTRSYGFEVKSSTKIFLTYSDDSIFDVPIRQFNSVSYKKIEGLLKDIFIHISGVFGFWDLCNEIVINLYESVSIECLINPELSNWNEDYTFEAYAEQFCLLVENDKEFNYFWLSEKSKDNDAISLRKKIKDEGFALEKKINRGNTIREVIEVISKELSNFHISTQEVLQNERIKITLLAAFNFPEELKIPCEQYLLYFAQFLQDLGINATSNLTEEAGKVLFSVTPTDDKEALDKIREALAVYLNLPSSPIVYDESFAAMRLKAEIERLQSSQRITEMEFRVTQKAIESQDKIILQQSVLLEQQAKVIEKITDKAIMINSAENKEELVELFDGLKVGESKFLKEQLGIHFNPAKTFNTLGKKLVGKEDEGKSILGLDD